MRDGIRAVKGIGKFLEYKKGKLAFQPTIDFFLSVALIKTIVCVARNRNDGEES